MNLRAVTWLLGCVLLILAVFMLVPLSVGLAFGERQAVVAFGQAAAISGFVGGLLVFWNRGSTMSREGRPDYFRREGLAVVGLAWIVAGAGGALPYLLAGTFASPGDAFFESVSGFTTTGATALQPGGIDALPKALSFWRSFSHWLGGFGIVMVFVVLFPAGGRNLFRSEVAGISREAGQQRVRDSVLGLMRIYVGMSVLESLLLWWSGLTWFDSLVHTFGTIATGGFSSHSESIAYFASYKVELIIVVFMFAAGINFSLYDGMLRLGFRTGLKRLVGSEEVRTYSFMVLASTLAIGCVLWFWGGSNGVAESTLPDYRSFWLAMRDSLFQVVSIQTSTGYGTSDFDRWPEFCRVLLMMLAIVGASAGSTGGGVKVVRFMIVAKAALSGVRRFVRPRAIHSVKVDGHTVDEVTVAAITSYFVLWTLVILFGTLALGMFGIEPLTASTAVLATLNNIGPGLVGVGPSMNYGALPELVKWLLSLFMILGRLEFYAVVALFVPGFWRR